MTTLMSNKDLLKKCKRFVQEDPTVEALDDLIKDALISAEREIRRIDKVPLAWLRESYDELFTRPYASISAITQANPGVITAESNDSDVTGHGFSEDDIAVISGVGGMERLNERKFRLARASATTLTLKQLHDQTDINTTDYEEYSSGGGIYHCGLIIPTTDIIPSGAADSYSWTLGPIFSVSFDMRAAHPISEEAAKANKYWYTGSGRPDRWRHLKYFYTTPVAASIEDFLLFYPPTSQRYNIRIGFEKDYPDLSVWDGTVYPPHPAEVHDAIWHRALFNLSTNAERQRRESKDGHLMGKIEVLYAEMWKYKVEEDTVKIIELNRRMIGDVGAPGASGGIAA